jgi:hypothetical protein
MQVFSKWQLGDHAMSEAQEEFKRLHALAVSEVRATLGTFFLLQSGRRKSSSNAIIKQD